MTRSIITRSWSYHGNQPQRKCNHTTSVPVPDCGVYLLDEKGMKYSIITSDKVFFGTLMKATKSTQVPQIIIDGEFVGNYQNLVEHFEGKNEST